MSRSLLLKTLSLAVIFAPSLLLAEPVYLECDNAGYQAGPFLKITVDESNQQVTVTNLKSDTSNRSKAVFSPDSVEFVENPNEIGTVEYYLSRTDLTYKMSFPSLQHSTQGNCKLIEKPKNQKF